MTGSRSKKVLSTAILVSLLLFLGIYWFNRGYGTVSPMTYEYSKALYSACLNRSKSHIDRVESLLANHETEALPPNERKWIDSIIAEANDGDWESASKMARRIMEDQVQY